MREFELLGHVYGQNAALPTRVTLPPGDDMGALRLSGPDVLVTVDQVADGVHVDLASTSLERVARKAVTRNLSDVAAMGALPAGAVVAASLPRGFGEERARRLFDEMSRVALAYDCPLFGGDVSIWDSPLLLTVTVLAEPRGVTPVTRAGGRAGDVVYVTGSLGGSLAEVHGYVHHLDFEPRLAVGRTLAGSQTFRPRCMIDLSDGLASDLAHLCRAAGGGVGAVIEEAALPIGPGAVIIARRDGQPLWRHALTDGEDYELCFALPPDAAAALPGEIGGVPITRVGELVAVSPGQPMIRLRRSDGAVEAVDAKGWEHEG